MCYEDSARYDFSADLFINAAGGFFAAAQDDVFPCTLYSGATGRTDRWVNFATLALCKRTAWHDK
jgi:hypothetical protein